MVYENHFYFTCYNFDMRRQASRVTLLPVAVSIAASTVYLYNALPFRDQIKPSSSSQKTLERTAQATAPATILGKALKLVGTWEQTDNPGKRGGETLTIEFRADGTFALRNDRVLEIFGKRSTPPASATSTGAWSIVLDPIHEMVTTNSLKPPVSLTYLGSFVNADKETIYLEWDAGSRRPSYFATKLSSDDQTLTIVGLTGDGGGTYTRLLE